MYSYEREALEKAGYSEVKFQYLTKEWKYFKVHKVGEGYMMVKVKKEDESLYKIAPVEDAGDVAPKWALPVSYILWTIFFTGLALLVIEIVTNAFELLLP